ncbi:DUF7577 domain-containing protein [Haloterrigena salifodinae]
MSPGRYRPEHSRPGIRAAVRRPPVARRGSQALLSGSARIGPDVERAATVDRDAETVVCLDCGAENDLGDRFCLNCVEALPGSAVRITSSAAPSRRDIV